MAGTSQQQTAVRALFFLGFLALVLAIVVLSSGCQLPQWRVFQKKVDPELAEKPRAQVEAERSAAKFIAQKSATVEAQPARQIEEIHAVAMPLSASLGEPAKPVDNTADARDRVIAELRQGVLAEQRKTEQWREFARKYAGKPIEDTGINLAGPAGLALLAAIVAACVVFPVLGHLLLRVVPVLWGYFSRTTEAIHDFASSRPDAGKELAASLSRKMDKAHKQLVRARANARRIPLPTPT